MKNNIFNQVKCKEDVFLLGELVLTQNQTYIVFKSLSVSSWTQEPTVTDDSGENHIIGNPGTEFFDRHFEVL